MAETKEVTLKQSTNKTSLDCSQMDQMASSHYQINRLSSVLESGPAIQNSLDLNATRTGSLTRFTLEASSRRIVLHHNQVQRQRKAVFPETHTLLFTIPRNSQHLESSNAFRMERILIRFQDKLQVETKFQLILRPLLRFATARLIKLIVSYHVSGKQHFRQHS